jgi:hypothetical protein
MGLFFEVWEVNDPAKCDEHDKICEEWILEYVHNYLGKSAIPHKLYVHWDKSTTRAMSVEYSTKEQMDEIMKTMFADEKFMEYYKKWEQYIDEPPKRYYFDELSPEVMMANYTKAKGI